MLFRDILICMVAISIIFGVGGCGEDTEIVTKPEEELKPEEESPFSPEALKLRADLIGEWELVSLIDPSGKIIEVKEKDSPIQGELEFNEASGFSISVELFGAQFTDREGTFLVTSGTTFTFDAKKAESKEDIGKETLRNVSIKDDILQYKDKKEYQWVWKKAVEEEVGPSALVSSITPPEGSTIAGNTELLITLDNPVKAGTNLTVNGKVATGSGKFWSWKGDLAPGLAAVKIEWINPDGSTGSKSVSYTVIAPDVEPPKIVSSFPKHGAKDLDPEALNEGGMEIKFSEPLKKVSVDVKIEGEALRWTSELSGWTVKVVMIKGGELPLGAEVVLVVNAEDFAGNKLEDAKIIFTTKAKELPGLDLKTLVGYWQFNEGKGDIVKDMSGNGNNGKINGAKWTKDGKYGEALDFDGVDDMVEIPDSKLLNITQSITMTAWIMTDNPKGGLIIGKEGAYGSSLGDGLNIKWIIWGDEWETKINILPNLWYHIALVYDFAAKKRLVYLNGKVMAEKETTIPIPVSDKPLIIGKDFKGTIDEVCLWSSTLNEKGVQTQMAESLLLVAPKSKLADTWANIKRQ